MMPLTSVSFSFYSCCLWLLFASSLCTLCSCNQTSDQVQCIATERVALIQFKNNLTDYGNRLSSWSGDDCCSWSGVVCDNSTHHVHEIRLSGHCHQLFDTDEEFDEVRKPKLGGMISPSLMKLEQLRYLDLSCNDFEFTPIPAFIGSLKNLRHLNISRSEFVGKIPHQFGNLSALRVLDVNQITRLNYDHSIHFYEPYNLRSESLIWLENMKGLQYLRMSGVNLTGASDWLQVINTLPFLQELHFSSCGLTQIPTEPTTVNFTSLTVLDLSDNDFFDSLFPGWIFSLHNLVSLDLTLCRFGGLNPGTRGGFENMPSLRTLLLSYTNFSYSPSILKGLSSLGNLRLLDVSGCSLSHPILSSLQNLSEIAHLDLSRNNIVEEIPRSFTTLCNLTTLNLDDNLFYGDVSKLLENLCECESPKLEYLSLRFNNLTGRLPERLGRLKNLSWLNIKNNRLTGILPRSLGNLSLLEVLDLSENQIEGSIPDSIGDLSSVYILDLSYNKLNGSLPESIGKLGRVSQLFLQHNSLTGIVTKNHFANLTSLVYLWAFDNMLAFDIANNWIPPFPLVMLSLGSCNLGPLFPLWVQSLTHLQVLNLANTSISGTIPDFLMNWEFLEFLNLESNNLSGKIPSFLGNIPSLRALRMKNNKLSGDIPMSLLNSKSLWIVELANNELTGRISMSIGRNDNTSLKMLSLRSNKLEGEIPNEMCHLSSIQILDIADNSFSGDLPTCFTNFSVISGKEKPTQTDQNEYLFMYQGLRDIPLVIKGHVSSYNTLLLLVTTLDLSSNKFSGSIPNELMALLGLRYLNLSQNNLTGRIPNTFSEMGELESLDLSVNNLDGNIPLSLAGLTTLDWLNVSYNNLTGAIPTGRQFQTFNDESCFVGNALCGAPLPGCRRNSDDTNTTNQDHGETDGIDWMLVLCMIVGLAVGFWITIGTLIVSKQWRNAYYQFLEEMWIKLANFILLLFIFGRRMIHRRSYS